MSEYMGDDHAVALQKALHARADEIAANPLLANGGRILNILDPEQYGWDAIQADVARDGYVGLTMVDRDSTLSRLAEFYEEGANFPYWEAFTGSSDDVLSACAKTISDITLPERWTVSNQAHPDEKTIHEAQILNNITGVAPTPAYFLRGDLIPSMLTCIRDENDEFAACASGTMRYHPEGPLAGWFFAGAVSVSPDHRRIGLGSYINAQLLEHSHKAHSWVRVLEQVKADNPASVSMIARCGLRQVPEQVTIVVNPSGQHVTR